VQQPSAREGAQAASHPGQGLLGRRLTTFRLRHVRRPALMAARVEQCGLVPAQGRRCRAAAGLPSTRMSWGLPDIPVPNQSIGGVVSGAACVCSVPPGGRFSRPIAARRLGRWMMSRLAGFYIAKAMESVAAGTTAAGESRIPPERAGDHAALDPTRTHDGSRPTSHRVAAAVRRFIGGLNRVRRGRRRLGHPRLPPPNPARQPSAH